MHHRLSQLLERDVIGPVAIVGERFFDAALGRICLDPFDPSEARALAQQVRDAFPDDIKIDDRLHAHDKTQLVRGVLDVWLQEPESKTRYLLQITNHPVLQVYERRFFLDAETLADTRGTLGEGLSVAVAVCEGPLKLISGFDGLLETYLSVLDDAMRRASVRSVNPSSSEKSGDSPPQAALTEAMTPLSEQLRDAWKLLPWALKKKLEPLGAPNRDRLVKHDQTMENTIIFAMDTLSGEQPYTYEHSPTPYDNYHKVVDWMTELARSVQEGYPSPRYAASVARAPSVDGFLHCFPGFQPVFGRTFESASE